MKALIIRHYGLLWSVSIMWELTEMVFGHLLPNFYECWWDNLVLDVLVCNGLGIFTGMQVCKYFEMREFKWESIKNISGAGGKFRRALLQFTPQSFVANRWLDPNSGYMRLIAVIQFMLIWQMVELNTFFIKHIFPMPAEHPVCVLRILLTGLISAPSCRQYYTYITDPRCKRIGTQCWVFIMVGFSELILVIKFGMELFSNTQISKMMIWFTLNIIVSCCGVFVSMEIYKWRHGDKKTTDDLKKEDEISGNEKMSGEEKVRRFLAGGQEEEEVALQSPKSDVRQRKTTSNS
jgi:phosphatidylserine synthase 1